MAANPDPFTVPIAEWAKTYRIHPAYAAHLAKEERIETPDGKIGAKKRGRDWFVRPDAEYFYKSLGGVRPGAGRKKKRK